MANAGYTSFYNGLSDALFDWDTATIKASLVRGYTFNAAHVFLSEVTGSGGTLVSTVTLTGKVRSDGALDAAGWSWPSVATGAAIPAFILYQASAPAGGADLATSAQRLIAYYDTQIGLPVVPNGQSIAYTPDTGVNKLLKI